MENVVKIPCKTNSALRLTVIPGHFATSHSHINFYMDMTTLKSRRSEAELTAQLMARKYNSSTIVDTIICMDGCEVIGAYLAEQLTQQGIMSINKHNTISIVTPEVHSNGQLIFRDNLQPMVKNKNIILLLASASTGKTIKKSVECIHYYGGIIQGVSAIFSASDKVEDIEVDSIFSPEDIPEYKTYAPDICPFCKEGQKLDAIVNGYGYSKL